LAEVQQLMDADPGTPDGDRLDVLVTLIEAYEDRHWFIEPPDPIEAIRIRMEQKHLRQRDLVPMIGSRGRASEVLSGKRPLTLPMIRRLSAGLESEPTFSFKRFKPSRRRHIPPRKHDPSEKKSA
jgi:HTH-type transcriptional regulator/antitoxin HigA